MAEPTVQVPVSLIERAMIALLEVPPSSRNADIYGDLSAILSQPTLSAEPDRTPCTAETHSWDHFRSTQVDSYWIRCTEVGEHREHSDSNTGLTWFDPSTIRAVTPPAAP
ncbi:hypothetical protein [Curtobacterium sp. MCLR17_034]|uniref:hypothetical protein n=1 Tax=Curtobacterium sp. MCLR17_034 TaxID=2175623 RepID=UPI000DA7545D|nr:hypothetical protein [Curtobacterium sp. MCLR17_034]PZF11783.1 hypothetical protein DEI98_06590 [Curtobacterium sp. MCLR17_034]